MLTVFTEATLGSPGPPSDIISVHRSGSKDALHSRAPNLSVPKEMVFLLLSRGKPHSLKRPFVIWIIKQQF